MLRFFEEPLDAFGCRGNIFKRCLSALSVGKNLRRKDISPSLQRRFKGSPLRDDVILQTPGDEEVAPAEKEM